MFLISQWRRLPHFSILRLQAPLFQCSAIFSSQSEQALLAKHNKSTGNSPTTIFSRLLRACENGRQLKRLMCLLIVLDIVKNEHLVAEIITPCFHFSLPRLALSVFRAIDKPSLLLQNLMVRGLSNHGLYEELLNVYVSCRFLGCSSGDHTFPFVVKACSELGAFGYGKAVHCVVLRSGFSRNLVIQTALVDFYGKQGHMGTAREVFDGIPLPDIVSCNALIAGYSLNGLNQDALEVFFHIFAVGLKPNLSTLASTVPVCTRLGCFHFGKSLHGYAVRLGYLQNDYLAPALISLYATNDELCTSRELFDYLLENNIAVWNAMIAAYTFNQKPLEAFEMFQQMLHANVQPNPITFVSIIPSCKLYSTIFHGESLHACVIKYGMEDKLSAQTALMSMYAKLGYIDSANFIFNQLPYKTSLTWNTMISGYNSNNLCFLSCTMFREMISTGFNPDAVCIVELLSACLIMEARSLGKSVHALGFRTGINLDLSVSNALLAFYSSCREFNSCFKKFQEMTSKDVVSWNTLISSCIHSGEVERLPLLLRRMQNEFFKMDFVTLISILPAFIESQSLKQATAIHGYSIRTGYVNDISLVNAFISMYCNSGDLDSAGSLFEHMPEKTVVSWNAMITGYRLQNRQEDMMVLFNQMMEENHKPNFITLLNLLSLCHTQSHGKSIHAFAIRSEILRETPLITSLIIVYSRFHDLKSCFSLFEMGIAESSHVSLWNAIISAMVQTKYEEKVIGTFKKLLREGLKPDHITYVSLLSACVQLNDLIVADSVRANIILNGFDEDVGISNALIDLYAKCGNILIAEKLFNSLLEKDTVSWSVMINGYSLHGNYKTVLKLFSEMQLSGVKPSNIIFLSILSACSHAGLVEQGQLVYNSMRNYGVTPSTEHDACIVDLLARTGHLAEAYELIKRLPCTPSTSILECLLGACRIYGNVVIGEKVADMAVKLDRENHVPYVMLHNIYAGVGRWSDAERMRCVLDRRRLKKLAGFSLIS